MLEAHTFARDAKSANTWITNQSGNLSDPPETATLDHIEALLKKFENFERAINAQSERFDAFKKTTRVRKSLALVNFMELSTSSSLMERKIYC